MTRSRRPFHSRASRAPDLSPTPLRVIGPRVAKGRASPELERPVAPLAQTTQDRPIEIPERRGLDPVGEYAREQPSRKMSGSDPAQMVSPLEAKPIHVESGKGADRDLELFVLGWRGDERDQRLADIPRYSALRHHAARRDRRFAARSG